MQGDIQLSLYEDASDEDIKKTKYILSKFKDMNRVIRDYENVQVAHGQQEKYLFYGWITNVVSSIIENVDNLHEKTIAKLLFIEGKRYTYVKEYMAKGYRKELHTIQDYAFSVRRREVIRKIANSLKIIGVLENVSLNENNQPVFIIPNCWVAAASEGGAHLR